MNADNELQQKDIDYIKDALIRIESQTIKTNGRVNKLENWRSLLVGGYVVFTGFLLPLLGYIYFDQQSILKNEIIDNQQEIINNQERINNLK